MDRDRDLALAGAVADGTEVDWDGEESRSAGNPSRLRLIRGLQAIFNLRQAHDRAASIESDHGSTTQALEPSGLERWAHFEIHGLVGEGAFGWVLKATDTRLDRSVALKLQRAAAPAESDAAGAAVAEGRLLAKVTHPNVVTVYGADRHDGRVGIWMELISGQTLSRIMRTAGPFGAREATLIGIDLCRALAAVHRERIVHRDVKAQNVMREDGGRIVLMDFGVGRDTSRVDHPESVSGTPLYMAPEVLRGEPANVRSDLYSVGVLLYHLVTGRFPLRGRSVDALRRMHAEGRFTYLRDARPDLPRSFIEVVERALSPDPEARYASAGEMEQSLVQVVGAQRPRVSSGMWLAAAAALAVLAAGAFLFGILPTGSAPSEGSAGASAARGQYELALEARAAGDLDAAINHLRRAVDITPDFALAHSHMADFYEGRGMYEEALRAAELGHESCCEGLTPAEIHFVKGTYHSTRMQMRAALDQFKLAAAEDKRNAEAWRKVGEAQAILGRSVQAAASFQKALELDPDHLLTRGWRALLLGMSRRYDEAFAELEEGRRIHARAQREDPTLGEYTYFYWAEGMTEFVRGNVEEARAAFTTMTEGDATFVSYGRLFLAQLMTYEGTLRDAAHELESGLPLDVQEGVTNTVGMRLNRLAWVYALLGEADRAKRQLELAERIPVLPTFLENIRDTGLLYVDLGQLDAARRIEQRLDRIHREYPSEFSRAFAAQIAGEIDRVEGDLDAAETQLELARRTLGDPLTIWSWARYLESRGRLDEAARNFAELRDAKGRTLQWHSAAVWVLSHLHLARCQGGVARELAQRGNVEEADRKREEAAENYRRLLELWADADPGNPTVVSARRGLDEVTE